MVRNENKGTSVVEEEVLVFCVESVPQCLTWVNVQVRRDIQLFSRVTATEGCHCK